MVSQQKIYEIPIVRKILDKATGEMTEENDVLRYTRPDLNNWIKVMSIQDEEAMMPLRALGTGFMVFYVMMQNTNWKNCMFDLTPSTKNEIMDATGIGESMILKYIKKFMDDSLIRQYRGISYMINPRYMFQGGEVQQVKLIKKFQDLVWIRSTNEQAKTV